eukprot:ANDGO_07796.mRNA.1 hypothetical protein
MESPEAKSRQATLRNATLRTFRDVSRTLFTVRTDDDDDAGSQPVPRRGSTAIHKLLFEACSVLLAESCVTAIRTPVDVARFISRDIPCELNAPFHSHPDSPRTGLQARPIVHTVVHTAIHGEQPRASTDRENVRFGLQLIDTALLLYQKYKVSAAQLASFWRDDCLMRAVRYGRCVVMALNYMFVWRWMKLFPLDFETHQKAPNGKEKEPLRDLIAMLGFSFSGVVATTAADDVDVDAKSKSAASTSTSKSRVEKMDFESLFADSLVSVLLSTSDYRDGHTLCRSVLEVLRESWVFRTSSVNLSFRFSNNTDSSFIPTSFSKLLGQSNSEPLISTALTSLTFLLHRSIPPREALYWGSSHQAGNCPTLSEAVEYINRLGTFVKHSILAAIDLLAAQTMFRKWMNIAFSFLEELPVVNECGFVCLAMVLSCLKLDYETLQLDASVIAGPSAAKWHFWYQLAINCVPLEPFLDSHYAARCAGCIPEFYSQTAAITSNMNLLDIDGLDLNDALHFARARTEDGAAPEALRIRPIWIACSQFAKYISYAEAHCADDFSKFQSHLLKFSQYVRDCFLCDTDPVTVLGRLYCHVAPANSANNCAADSPGDTSDGVAALTPLLFVTASALMIHPLSEKEDRAMTADLALCPLLRQRPTSPHLSLSTKDPSLKTSASAKQHKLSSSFTDAQFHEQELRHDHLKTFCALLQTENAKLRIECDFIERSRKGVSELPHFTRYLLHKHTAGLDMLPCRGSHRLCAYQLFCNTLDDVSMHVNASPFPDECSSLLLVGSLLAPSCIADLAPLLGEPVQLIPCANLLTLSTTASDGSFSAPGQGIVQCHFDSMMSPPWFEGRLRILIERLTQSRMTIPVRVVLAVDSLSVPRDAWKVLVNAVESGISVSVVLSACNAVPAATMASSMSLPHTLHSMLQSRKWHPSSKISVHHQFHITSRPPTRPIPGTGTDAGTGTSTHASGIQFASLSLIFPTCHSSAVPAPALPSPAQSATLSTATTVPKSRIFSAIFPSRDASYDHCPLPLP